MVIRAVFKYEGKQIVFVESGIDYDAFLAHLEGRAFGADVLHYSTLNVAAEFLYPARSLMYT